MDLNKTIQNARFLGVCAWLSKQTKVDVKLIRVIFIIITLVGVGSPIIVYLILFAIKAIFF